MEALAADPVDAAIVDIRLPGIDGNTLICRARETAPSLKFLIHTGSTSYYLPSFLSDIGIKPEDVFKKPLSDMGVMADAARRLVGRE